MSSDWPVMSSDWRVMSSDWRAGFFIQDAGTQITNHVILHGMESHGMAWYGMAW